MKIQLLGSGASDGIPAMIGSSRVAEYARSHRGKDLRTRSAALIDDQLKLDFGPDTLAQIQTHNLDAEEWLAIVFTHSHDDHLCLSQLQYLLWPFCEYTYCPIPIYGNDGVVRKLQQEYPDWPIELVLTRSFEPFEILDYRITPIKAYHMLEEDAQNLIIEREGVTFLYATDTGYWRDETWEFLQGRKLDGLVIECTEGLHRTDYYGHLDLPECLSVVERLRTMGTLSTHSWIATTHHSHQGDLTHSDLETKLRPAGMEPGFDGMERNLKPVSG